MARPGERMRLKDRIVDNISKSIKSIQELVYYQYKDPLLTRCDDSVVLYNNSRLCHKLCENLDHTLLHGLKHVIRGYWRVVKQLSPHAMVREIDLLVNVTTDLGKGRSWLYASLNEGLLESYIRLLCDNDKLLKKYYAKEALVLDKDRMSVLLTLTSGLDCVTFKLEYDLPYLDLNAYPPRSRSNSEQDGDVSSDSSDSYLGHPCRYRSMSEVFSNSPQADFQLANDSDSASLASLDVCQMKASTISADSGFPTDGMSTNGTRPSTEAVVVASHQNGISADSASLSSLSSSSGDPDRHQRLESVSSSFGGNDAPSLEVIRMKGKKSLPGKSKRKKVEGSSLVKSDAKGIQSDFGSQEKYINNNKAVSEGISERKLHNMGNGSMLAKSHMVKNVSCDCRQRERDSHNTSSDVSTTGFEQNSYSHASNLTPSSTQSSATRIVCAEVGGSILPLTLTTKGCTASGYTSLPSSSNRAKVQEGTLSSGNASSRSESLPNSSCKATAYEDIPSTEYALSRPESLPDSSNTAAAHDGIVSSGSVCLSAISYASLVQDGSNFSEFCDSDTSDASSLNSSKRLIPTCISLLPDSCVGEDQSFKSIKGNPTAHLMPDTLGQSKSCLANSVQTDCEEEETVVDQHSLSEVVCDVTQVCVACNVQSQPNGSCVQGEHIGEGDENRLGVSCVQGQSLPCVQSRPDGACVQSRPDGACIHSQLDGTCTVGQQSVPCAQCQPDKACLQSPLEVTSVQSQHTGACVHGQPDVPGVQSHSDVQLVQGQPNTSSIKSQLGMPDVLHLTNSSCDEQVKIKTIIDNSVNEDSDFSYQAEDDVDVYSSNASDAAEESHRVSESLELTCEVSSAGSMAHLEGDNSPLHNTADSHDAIERHRPEEHLVDVDLSLRLDNNMVLHLMLEVFCHEDEQLLKMFVTWQNQTEGGTNVAYLLISNHCLYVLHYQRTEKKFVQQSCTALTDIIFLSVGLNGQTLNIESRGKNKQKQRLWLTPGNHNLSQSIVACLTEAVKAANEHSAGKSRFSVGSEVPLQKIALRKYISTELSIKPQDVTLLDYSLVFWEDLSSAISPSHSGVYKEGRLELWVQGPLNGHVWKPVYVILKNNILSVKDDKSDLRPHCFLSLGGDQCVGCRLTSHSGRDHCVELILAQGGSWILSGGSQADVSDWRHCLCLAVSQGTVESDISAACVPCCAVLANQHLFLCHEDLYSKFHRTLARLRLEDVTRIALDGTDSTYCIVKLKSQESEPSSRQWAFYFYSSQDMERQMSAIRATWKDIHQTELPVLPVDDVAVECSCNSCSSHLKRQLTLS